MPALLSPSSSKVCDPEFVTNSRVGTSGRITHVWPEVSLEWQEKIKGIAEASSKKEAEVVRECDRDLSVQD